MIITIENLLRPCVPISSSAEATSAPLCLPAHFQMKEKVDVAFSVAASFAQIGKKVIFIDADIRKSVLVSRYQLEGEVNGPFPVPQWSRKTEKTLLRNKL